MQNFTLFVFARLKDHGVQAVTYPANSPMLFWNIGSLVGPVGLGEQLLHFLESYATLGIRFETLTLSSIETETHPV
ncbi:MAG TPA: hypothetical protein VLM42_14480 [Bryobacteraceae bacterium]|nr:hypothetical protein [Bryobacteraceae bacterium]